MAMMKAAVMYEAGGPEVLKVESLPIPKPQKGQVLIRVKAFGLNRSELWALVAFLESLGGTVDVKLDDIPKTAGAPAAGGGTAAAELTLPGDPKAGQALFTGKAICFTCHTVDKIAAGKIGPDLTQIAKIQTPQYIMGKILNPAAMGTVPGYPKGVMPPTFGQMLTAKEYVDLVAFLLTLK